MAFFHFCRMLTMRLKSLPALLILFLLILSSCNNKHLSSSDEALFQLVDNSGIDFTNTVVNTKDFNIFTFRNFYNGGGAAIGDLNNDGLADIFFTSNSGSNKFYLNRGNWKFEDVSAKAGFGPKEQWSTGVVLADINHDGWLDIYISNSGNMMNASLRRNQLYINNHNLTFSDSAAQYGLADSGYTTQASFFDYDLDGDLDCFLINNSPIPVNTLNNVNKRDLASENWPVANFLKGGGDHLYRNDNGHFSEITKQSGIHGSLISLGLGVTVADVNQDGYPDLYISNDFFERDYLYINQKNGSFKDELENWVQHTSLSSMGADMADINNDGYPDIFTTDMLPGDDYRLKTTTSFENIDVLKIKQQSGFYNQFTQNTMQLNNGNGKFLDIANYSGVAASDWSWGGLMFDADNDGYNDLYICNGINRDVTDQDFIDFFANDVIQKMVMTGKKDEVDDVINKMPSNPVSNKAFRNKGDLTFEDAGTKWGFTQPSFSNGAAYGDLDNDGDLDLVINNVNQPAFIYRNTARESSPKNHFIGFNLKGIGQNVFAIGSKIKIYQGKNAISRELIPSKGFQSSMDYKILAGLGNNPTIDSVQIEWPNLTYSTLTKPAADSVYTIQQTAQAIPFKPLIAVHPSSMLAAEKSNFEKHTEDEYIDFYYERNIPEMLSQEGPKATVADVNGDSLDDVYIGGAANQAGQLYLQTPSGEFQKKEEPMFLRFADFEDVPVLFFDCDNDGDKDLFVGAGGNNVPVGGRNLQHRLYKNDGRGNFEIALNSFPSNDANISVAIASDFDNDGDLDLFVGGRSVPQSYGVSPSSYILKNDGQGHFTDVTKTVSPDIAKIGMVTGAVWADITGDGKNDLVITGEWMATRIFTWNNGHFDEIKSNLNDMPGLWQSVAAADLNGDGKQDLILGNIGDNFYLRPNSDAPVKIWINDFNHNGSIDKVITRSIAGKDMPVFLKRDMTDDLPELKKENLRYVDYAKKSINDLFDASLLKSSQVKLFAYSSTCIAINEGNGKFTIKKLAPYVQFSSVNAIRVQDVNDDGFNDIILAGNKFGFLPQFERLDASLGNVLLNDGKANFTCLSAAQSGLEIRGQVRDIQPLKTKNGNFLLFLQNNDYPVLYGIKNASKINSVKN